jgi:hypothetical protein
MGQSKPPAGGVEQRDAGVFLDELNPSRDPRQGELSVRGRGPARAFASPTAAEPDRITADIKFSPVQSRYYSLLFPAALRHIAG